MDQILCKLVEGGLQKDGGRFTADASALHARHVSYMTLNSPSLSMTGTISPMNFSLSVLTFSFGESKVTTATPPSSIDTLMHGALATAVGTPVDACSRLGSEGDVPPEAPAGADTDEKNASTSQGADKRRRSNKRSDGEARGANNRCIADDTRMHAHRQPFAPKFP